MKWAKSKQRSQSPNSFVCKVKIYSPRRVRRYLSPGNYSSYFIIHLRHKFSLILGLILLKLKHGSNRPVNPSCLQSNTKKLLPYHISTLSSKVQYTTWYYNSQRQKIPQNPFPAKNLLKQTTYLLLEAKTSSYFIACVKTRNSNVSNYLDLPQVDLTIIPAENVSASESWFFVREVDERATKSRKVDLSRFLACKVFICVSRQKGDDVIRKPWT